MDSDLYDEFGNFIGSDSDESLDYKTANATEIDTADAQNSVAVVEPAVETILIDPTEEGRDEPVIKPAAQNLLENAPGEELPETTYSKEYLKQVAQMPERLRSFAVCGALHSGKSSLVDEFLEETHPGLRNSARRHLDTHKLEIERGISLFASPASILLQDLKHRSYLCQILDTPGHPDFYEERAAALRLSDGVLFVLDVLEGLTFSGKQILTEIIRANLPVVVVLNKIDRLVLELRLPPRQFQEKVRSVLADVNGHVHHNEHVSSYSHETLFSPLCDNVVFSLRVLGTSFSLHTWALLYADKFAIDEKKLATLLWGDVSFRNGKFVKLSETSTFEQFIVTPLYKLITHSLVFDSAKGDLARILWEEFRIVLPKNSHKLDPQDLLRTVFGALSQGTRDVVNLIALALKKERELDEVEGPVAEVAKPHADSLLVRVRKGELKVGQRVRVNGNLETVQALSIPCGSYSMAIDTAYEGQVVLVSGFRSVDKCATITSPENKLLLHRTDIGKKSVYKVAVEPEIPSDLPRLVRGLQFLSKRYVSAVTKLEESGEHVILAPGELYLDCFLHDLRHFEADYLSIKVSDPMVRFSESCVETSATRIPIQTPNGKSEISIIAEPVNDKRLLAAIEQGRIHSGQPAKTMSKILKEEFSWDALAARSVWAFGPSDLQSPSVLLDDSLEGETNKGDLKMVQESIVTGFKMGINEGPLCDEPIRRTKFKILDAVLGDVLRSTGQAIPMTRNAVHCGLMTAAPRLLEPMYKAYVTCTYNTLQAVHTMLEKRRGWVIFEKEVPGTKLFEVEGIVPVIDSPGLDTDMRLNTQGQAFCTLEFSKWNVVPGDPLDEDCILPAMKPVPRASLARDFVMKTRKRKGLSGEPSLQKYVGLVLYTQMKQSGIIP